MYTLRIHPVPGTHLYVRQRFLFSKFIFRDCVRYTNKSTYGSTIHDTTTVL